ncbi:MAG: gliding motility-associated C-terminal domain-containing protein [Bacteroidetes bacterium]|nr:gliding motility-associated C-terminal domain-containing protein [Bacteroidota bacterium]
MLKKLFIFILFLTVSTSIISQNTTCANAAPFCTGTTYNFPASTNAGNAQTGPNYTCLGSQPNPAWYYLQIQNPGNLNISLAGTGGGDVDFTCWGPFPNLNNVCNNLTAGNTVDCSYSASATETVHITGAIAGQFYLILITNYSNITQNINFVQTSGNGTTNCGLLCIVTPTNSGNVCAGFTSTLSTTTSTGVTSVNWVGPSGAIGSATSVVTPTLAATTVFTITGTTSSGSCAATTTVNVTTPTPYTVTPQTVTVCQGGIFTPSVYFGPVLPGTPCSNTGVGPACATPAQIVLGTGSGANSSSSYPSPYAKWWNDCHEQFLYRASELTAMGVQPGYITSLAFNVSALNGVGMLPNYTIKIKCTAATQATTFDLTGLTTVYTANYNPITGWNQHNFATPYYWDGTSNLLVDVCFSNTSWSFNASSPFTTTPFTSCVWRFSTNMTTSSCNTALTSGTSANRPNTRFGNCSSPNPNAYSYLWSPGPGIAAPTASTTAITTQAITGASANVIYSVVVTPTNINCPSVQTLTATIINVGNPTLTIPGPLCSTSGTQALMATPGGGTWSANTSVSNLGVLTPSLAAAGTSTVLYSVNVGSCIASSTGSIDVSTFNPSTLTGSIAPICITASTVDLMALVQSTVNGVWTGANVIGTYSFNPAGLATNTYVLTYSTTSSPNPTICPSSNTLAVDVTATLTPTIIPLPEYCNNSTAVINMSVTPSGGTWTGNAAIGTSGIVNPALASIGTSTVLYTVGIGPCVNTNTTSILISQFNTAALTGTLNHQCYNFTPASLNAIVQSTVSGVWSGQNVTGSYSFNPSGLPTGNYNLTYNTTSSPNTTLCPDTRSIAVYVLNPPSPIIPAISPLCSNALPFVVNASPTTGTWTSAAYLNTLSGVFTPSLAVTGNNTVQYTTGTPTCSISQSISIYVDNYIASTITGSISDQCYGNGIVNLVPLPLNTGGTWLGPGVTGSNFDPNGIPTGVVTLTYNTVSQPSGLCASNSTLAVNVFSLAPPSIFPVNRMCNSAMPFQLQATPVGGYYGSLNSGGVDVLGNFKPSLAAIGDNIISYTVTSGVCKAYAQTTITIEAFVSADFASYAGPYCKNDAAINLNSLVQNQGGTFTSTSPGFNGTNVFTPIFANLSGNNIIIYQTHSMPTASLCPDTAAIRIYVSDIPVVQALSNIYSGCSPLKVDFNTPSATNGTGIWSFGDGSPQVTGLNSAHIYNTPGSYTVTFYYANDIGCKTQTVVQNAINVFETPKADFDFWPHEISLIDPVAQFTNQTVVLTHNTYNWQIDNLVNTVEVHPKITFPKAGDYQVTLTANSAKGCTSKITKTISVINEYGVYIPNTFTPNGDGLNDVFLPVFSPYGLDLSVYELEVFDRWGELMFHTNDPKVGWAGTKYNKGTDDKEDVYIYKIKYKDATGKTHNKTGHVTLLK